mmetsp:Transcript_49656/g.153339  ORF Transcript_49656/g.153339 Transcript_49656/m.153339 type:complete len:268 (-) Transcript_49656:1232-2035(-)
MAARLRWMCRLRSKNFAFRSAAAAAAEEPGLGDVATALAAQLEPRVDFVTPASLKMDGAGCTSTADSAGKKLVCRKDAAAAGTPLLFGLMLLREGFRLTPEARCCRLDDRSCSSSRSSETRASCAAARTLDRPDSEETICSKAAFLKSFRDQMESLKDLFRSGSWYQSSSSKILWLCLEGARPRPSTIVLRDSSCASACSAMRQAKCFTKTSSVWLFVVLMVFSCSTNSSYVTSPEPSLSRIAKTRCKSSGPMSMSSMSSLNSAWDL